MSRKQPGKAQPPDAQAGVPYGTQTPRPRWVLLSWIVLYAAWLAFLLFLAARESLH